MIIIPKIPMSGLPEKLPENDIIKPKTEQTKANGIFTTLIDLNDIDEMSSNKTLSVPLL